MKLLRFAGSATADLSAFPVKARARAGYELFLVQTGRDPSSWKPMPIVGPGAAEIRVRDETGSWRVIYVARFTEAVYVLHAFRKKSQKTAREDILLAEQRYRDVKAIEKE